MAKTFRKIVVGSMAVIALVFCNLTPAFATGPTVTLNIGSDNKLTDSIVSGFNPNDTLYMTLFVSAGQVSVVGSDAGMAAVHSYGGSSLVPGLILRGNLNQLVATLPLLKVFPPCDGGNYTTYLQVNTSPVIQNPVSGHFYQISGSTGPWEGDRAAALATSFPYNASGTHGYLATITSPLENRIAQIISQNSLIGASDVDVEGDWKWLDGPEAGTLFFRGTGANGSAVNGNYTNWRHDEPNNWGSGEDSSAIYFSDGTWNDASGAGTYMVEFGGLPGDDLSGSPVQISSVTKTSTPVFAQGNGTQGNPYKVDNASRLYDTWRCSGDKIYFLQTADITLPANWQGDGLLLGHYEGGNHSITFAPNTVVTDDFGVFRNIGQDGRDNSEIGHVTVSGNLTINGKSRVGMLASHTTNSSLQTIGTTGTMTVSGSGASIAGVAAYLGYTDAHNINSTVSITGSGYSMVSGVFSEGYGELETISWNGTIQLTGTNLHDVGGIVANGEEMSGTNLAALGTIDTQGYSRVGGLFGIAYSCYIQNSQVVDITINAHEGNLVGGLFGETQSGEYSKSMVSGHITGNDYVGGLAGRVENSDIYNMESSAVVTGNDTLGLFIGYALNDSIVNLVSDGDRIFGLQGTGRSTGSFGSLDSAGENVIWDPSSLSVPYTGTIANSDFAASQTELRTKSYYESKNFDISSNWNDGRIWSICAQANNGIPFITALFTEDPCAVDQTLNPIPLVTGSAKIGGVLTGIPGTWDQGTTQTFRWLRDGNPIAGATALTYTSIAGDIGHLIKFEVTSQGQGFHMAVQISAGVRIVPDSTEIKFGGFVGNSWWLSSQVLKGIPSWSKQHKSGLTLKCVGIVTKFGTTKWQRTVGLNRARAVCNYVKRFIPSVRVTFDHRLSSKVDPVRRGVALIF